MGVARLISVSLRTIVHIKFALTFVAIAGTSTTQGIDPLLLGDTELTSEPNRRQDASSCQIDIVEGIHQ